MRITENGLISVTKNLTYLADFIISYTTVPDMVINISKLTFELTNLKFTQLYIPEPNVAFFEDTNQFYFDFENANAMMGFEFKMQQQVYPYMQEQGNGYIGIGQLNVDSYGQLFPSTECPGRMELSLQNFYLYVDSLTIQLNSENSWLYEGILQIMSNVVVNIFNTQLQSYFKDFIEDNTNYGMSTKDPDFKPFDGDPVTTIDQRILDFKIKQQFADLFLVGTYCYIQEVENENYEICSGHVMELDQNYTMNIDKPTNYDIQFYFGIQSFISLFQQFVQNETIQNIIQQCEDPEVVNIGLSIQCMDKNNQKIQYQFKPVFEYKNEDSAFILMYLQLKDEQYPYYQQINDALYQLSNGLDMGYQFQLNDCWPLYSYDNYVSINCNF